MNPRAVGQSVLFAVLASMLAIPITAQNVGQHTVVLVGLGETVGYTITVDGSIEQVRGSLDGWEVTAQENDRTQAGQATGFVGHGGRDGFRVDGRIREIVLARPGAASIFVDGQPFHQLVIQGTGETVSYTLDVEGRVEPVEGEVYGVSATIQDNDLVQDGRATGYVGGGGADAFQIYGRVQSLSFDAPGAVRVLADGVPLHTLAIRGTDESVEYTVEVDGWLQQVEGPFDGLTATIQENDNVADGTATGYVGNGGTDAFLVYGGRPEVTLTRPGAAEILIDGEALPEANGDRPKDQEEPASPPTYHIAEAVTSVTDRAGEGPVDNTRRLDFGTVPLRALIIGEEADRPCRLGILSGWGEDQDRENIDVCRNPITVTDFAQLFEPADLWAGAPNRHNWVVAADVCVNHTGRNARLKGINLHSLHPADYLDRGREDEATIEGSSLPNCSHWSTVSCPHPQIATGVVTTWRQVRRNEWINGLRLVCRTATER